MAGEGLSVETMKSGRQACRRRMCLIDIGHGKPGDDLSLSCQSALNPEHHGGNLAGLIHVGEQEPGLFGCKLISLDAIELGCRKLSGLLLLANPVGWPPLSLTAPGKLFQPTTGGGCPGLSWRCWEAWRTGRGTPICNA